MNATGLKGKLQALRIETGSWAYAESGTRFKVFHQKGAARNIMEKIQDAAEVHKWTGACPTVAVHMLWDFLDAEPAEAKQLAESLGIRIGAVNPTLFEREEYKFGSIANPSAAVRQKAVRHMLDSIEIMRQCDSKIMSIWLGDGTNYPGQDDFRKRKHRLTECLKQAHDALDPDMQMLIEYKFFEPSFYSTDIADWGMTYVYCKACGDKAKVLVDLGHHPQGTNIEHIVSFLVDEDMLGGFHFNCRKYADDDLTTGSVNPYELFLIFNELVGATGGETIYDVAYMIDQSHNIKPKVEAMIQSVVHIQETYVKALLVDRKALAEAQAECDVIGAERILKRAYGTDVTPLLAEARKALGLEPDPLETYRQSDYQQEIECERG